MHHFSAHRPFSVRVASTVVILATLVLAACSRPGAGESRERKAADPIPVRLASVERRGAQRTVDVTGTLYGAEEATISAVVPGRVESIACDVGDVVDQGSVLAQIESLQYSLALDQKRAAMLESLASLGLTELPGDDFDPAQVPTVVKARRAAENAEARFHRAEQLWKQDPPLISEQDFSDLRTARDLAKSDADVALLNARSTLAAARSRRVEIALAQERLDHAAVRAPQLGEASPGGAHAASKYAVAGRLVSIGEYVTAGAPMFRLIASDPIKFRADVPERFVDQLRVGQSALLRVEAYPDAFSGTVVRVNPQINVRNRTFQVEIDVPNADNRLRAGAFGRCAVVIGEDADVPFVPEAAIVSFAGISKVFSVADGKAVEHRIDTGRRSDGLVEIIGAPAGLERVVVSGGRKLATGTPVREADASEDSSGAGGKKSSLAIER
ncbi:MAG: efflux RND transporter periplasmic adaptor subunit [Phycisphaerales bacterium]